ncbi:hypothetical protein DBR32_04090 [Taibaiella sp. KBW10]|uniref:hypothetical protein n=1 Tax=Taibaiella sp. KBW10 TaxID=2153357 RepID=UPI000F59C291|nr:hypothetical protein [Taibaiella sp. KBW10]RQO31989.1 hypothetical protein DBR32_04090 [Taibaiella sp. KBW10]
MKKIVLAFGILGLSLASCHSDKNLVEAEVVDTGDISSDGCGYLLRLNDSALLKPLDLPSAYHHNGLAVKIEYSYSGKKDTCNYGPKVYEMVNITKIKKDI